METVDLSTSPLLHPKLMASWEKGLAMVQQGEVSEADYTAKFRGFVTRRIGFVVGQSAGYKFREAFEVSRQYYPAVTERGYVVWRKGDSKRKQQRSR